RGFGDGDGEERSGSEATRKNGKIPEAVAILDDMIYKDLLQEMNNALASAGRVASLKKEIYVNIKNKISDLDGDGSNFFITGIIFIVDESTATILAILARLYKSHTTICHKFGAKNHHGRAVLSGLERGAVANVLVKILTILDDSKVDMAILLVANHLVVASPLRIWNFNIGHLRYDWMALMNAATSKAWLAVASHSIRQKSCPFLW
ncbi:hypothetical protein ACJX0J_020324, partial [Zea mays]